jgi:hypothetical protein
VKDMNVSRLIVAGSVLAAAVLAAPPASAVRVAQRPLLLNRAAVSGYAGAALAVGEFSDSREGYGNHADQSLDWPPPDWAVEIEYFAGRTWSLGFSYAASSFEDKDVPALETDLDTYSGFIRIVVPTASPVRPYLRAGMGGVDLEFLDPDARYEADTAFSIHVGGGLLWLPVRWLGLNAQALYYHGSTDDEWVRDYLDENGNPVVVGFNTEYWSFTAGVSLFFP